MESGSPKMSFLKEKAVILLAKIVFYINAFLWLFTKRRKAETMRDVLELFYYDFLRIDKKDLEVVRLTDNLLITRARNPCPILKTAMRLGIDTRVMCREVSEPVCKFVLLRLNPALIFYRNYSHIRPYTDSCEEIIIKAY